MSWIVLSDVPVCGYSGKSTQMRQNSTTIYVSVVFLARRTSMLTGILVNFLVSNRRPENIYLHDRQASPVNNCLVPLGRSTRTAEANCWEKTQRNCCFWHTTFDCSIRAVDYRPTHAIMP